MAKKQKDFELSPENGNGKKTRTARHDVARVIKTYHDEHLKRHGIKPLIGGKHASLIGIMVTNWTEETVERLVREFIWGNDPWAVKCGWTVEAFYHVAPRMLTKASQIDERTAANVDAAMRATQRRDS